MNPMPALNSEAVNPLRRVRSVTRASLVIAGSLALGGCTLLSPKEDPTRFYVLAAATPAASSAATEGAPSVYVRPVELPDYIRARPLLVRKGENELEFRDFARWSEPLEHGVARLVRDGLLARGAASHASVSRGRTARRPYDWELSIRVLACEGAASGEVLFRARWELASNVDKTAAPVRGEFQADGLRWDGKTDASLVAELSRAVAAMAGEIGAALPRK